MLSIAMWALEQAWDIVDKNDDNALSKTEIRMAYNTARTYVQRILDNFM